MRTGGPEMPLGSVKENCCLRTSMVCTGVWQELGQSSMLRTLVRQEFLLLNNQLDQRSKSPAEFGGAMVLFECLCLALALWTLLAIVYRIFDRE
jgi:hypothetical protein